jgi:hypothetical protein
MKKLFCFLCVSCSVLFVFGMSEASLIQNGDFEAGGLSPWSSSGDVQIATAGVAETAWGMSNNFASLGGSGNLILSTLSQEFDVTGLTELAISFNWFFGNIDFTKMNGIDVFAAIVKQDSVLFPMTTDLLLQESTQLVDVAYGTFSDVIDISSWFLNDGKISFTLFENPLNLLAWSSAGVDNVSVAAPVPEPATVLLIASGLLSLAGYRKRLQRK